MNKGLVWLVAMMSGCFVPDSVVEAYLDADGDGERTHLAGGPDCADDDAHRNSRAVEACDGVDNDCDGDVDESGLEERWWVDGDGDGFGRASEGSTSCVQPVGYAARATDCDDARDDVHPEAAERCGDGVDNDCDGAVADGTELVPWFGDGDGDGRGGEAEVQMACELGAGWSVYGDDCDDADPAVHPGARDDFYDGVDHNCDGADEFDRDGDGYAYDPADPSLPDCDDLDAAVHPTAVEVWYDGVDQNCDGADDYDADRDGFASDVHGGTDCDDVDGRVHPSAHDEPYDGLDADCDPSNDDDVDGDGVDGGPSGTDCDDRDERNWLSCDTCRDIDEDGGFVGCDSYASGVEDCDDLDPSRHPAAPEIYSDGVDQDCDGIDLDTTHPAIVFVSTAGVDGAGCGALLTPCRSLEMGSQRAALSGKVVFAEGGTYSAFETSVSVYGGFSPGFEERDLHAHPTLVTSVGGDRWVGATLNGTQILLDGLDVRGSGIGMFALGVRATAEEQTLRDVRVELTAPSAVGVEVKGRVVMDGGVIEVIGTGDISGVEVVGPHDVAMNDVSMELHGGWVYGIHGGTPLAVSRSAVHISAADRGYGIDSSSGVIHDIRASTFQVESSQADELFGVLSGAERLHLVQSQIRVTGPLRATGLLLRDGAVVVDGSVIDVHGSVAYGLSASGGPHRVVHLSSRSFGPSSVAILLGGPSFVMNSAVVSSQDAIGGVGPFEFVAVAFESPTMYTIAHSFEEFMACTWLGCTSVVGLQEGVEFQGDDALAGPAQGSSLLGAGADSSLVSEGTRDALGADRPVMGADLGGVQRPTEPASDQRYSSLDQQRP